ncbi:hypothetical protein PQQ84_36090 [Paraburkholderia strydomiana]|uniref:hypothetical protein n=1 Tax=Paraburkholderia strydomiana TaxID=1245417 RepID=UPI0038B7B234
MNEVTGRVGSTGEHDAALDDTPDTLKVTVDHLRLVFGARRHQTEAGRAVVLLVERYEAVCVARDGDTPAIWKQARGSVYQFIANKTMLSCDTIKLYARCYEKFGDSGDAVEYLTLSDMQLLLPESVDDDLIAHIVEARKFDPDLRREEIRKMMREYRAGRCLTVGRS